MKVQIGFYLDHVKQLTEAVEEFTGFLCQAGLYDITGGINDVYSTLSKVPIGRYDNVAMYLEKGVGKLGLIDLESFYPKFKSEQRESFFACREAIRLFPHHLDAIIHAAKGFDPNIENHRKAEPISMTHVPSLYDAFSIDLKGINWTYMPYGPFTNSVEFASGQN